ncbi:MAG: TlpA family protein disulfide reductase [Thermoanaerobaculia bacterium]|nr:TlpA family protein disulfide reductase [Thermoanaerobaculia bacterium]
MRFRVVTPIAVLALLLAASAPGFVLVPPERPLGVGDVAPALEVESWLHGPPVKLFAPGTVYVIEFWATWCGPCVANVPRLSEIARAYRGRVEVVGATSPDRWGNSLEAVRKFITAKGERIAYHVAWLPESAGPTGDVGIHRNPWFRQAGLENLPTAFVVDGRGRIAWIGDPLTVDGPLRRILAGDWDLAAATRRWGDSRRAEGQRRKLEQLLTSGDVAAARTLAFRLVRREGGDDPRLMSLVASAIAGSPLKADRALLEIAFEASARSVSLTQRKSPGMLDVLARVQFLRGDVADAIESEESAIALSEGGMQDAQRKNLAEFRAAARTAKERAP